MLETMVAWAMIIFLVWNWKGVMKFIGFFMVGFFLGLKGFNPFKWFD